MIRTILAILAGYTAWTALWLTGNNVLFPEATRVVGEGQAYTSAGPLAGVIVLSIVCSLVAGLLTARIARQRAAGAVVIMAALLLLTGIGVQFGVWALMPVWYHLVFLLLLVPMSLVGGRLGRRVSV